MTQIPSVKNEEGSSPTSNKPGEGVTLSKQQMEAVEQITNTDKRVVVLTGQAGAGKTTIINHLQNSGLWAVSATTGKAAMHINGVTVDSLFCFRRENWDIWSESYLDYIMTDLPDNIVVDEASGMGLHMGDIVYRVAKAYKKKLLLVGDWAQSSPVKDGLILDSDILADFDFIKLTENHRQDDAEFMEVLNKVRLGVVDSQVEDMFQSRVLPTPPDEDEYIRMYATNAKTDAYNQARLWKHVSAEKVDHFRIFASFQDMRPLDKQKERPRTETFKMKAIESSPFGHGEPLAKGCRVVLTSNDSPAMSFVNGDSGVLVGAVSSDGRTLEECLADYRERKRRFGLGFIKVLLDRTGRVVQVPRQKRDVSDPTGRYVQHTVSGFPIRLGYAITIHKAQGMTVDKSWFDMSSLGYFPDDESRHGLAYVALSRARTLDGLYIRNWQPDLIYCNPAIKGLL